VTIEGLLQDPTDYSISGTTLTITAPDSGQSIAVRAISSVATNKSFSGARVYNSASFATTAAANTLISWDTEAFDDGGWWSPTTADSFIIPAGVSRVNATLSLYRSASVAGQFIATISHYNSSNVLLGILTRAETDTGGGDSIMCSTGPIAVSEGDRLKGGYYVDNAGNMDGSAYGCSFSINALVSIPASVPTLAITTTTYDLLDSDKNKYLRFTNSGAKTINVRPQATHATTLDAEWNFRNVGAANLTVAPGAGVTVNVPYGGTLVIPQGGTATLKYVATNEFDLLGQTVSS
jgi:hypothetical protein